MSVRSAMQDKRSKAFCASQAAAMKITPPSGRVFGIGEPSRADDLPLSDVEPLLPNSPGAARKLESPPTPISAPWMELLECTPAERNIRLKPLQMGCSPA